jgi:4-amino-4-deoxychorismate lyase
MCPLVETIRSEDGELINLEFHNKRMMRTLFELFGLTKDIDLAGVISVPDSASTGVFKCRLEYDNVIMKTEFIRYNLKPVRSLKIIEDNAINYSYKFTDRRSLERLLEKRNECDDILITKNGFITDTSYSNVILRDISGVWHTPATYLLPGTRRASLLHQSKIRETKIHYRDLENYLELKLINSMLGIEDSEGIPIRNII